MNAPPWRPPPSGRAAPCGLRPASPSGRGAQSAAPPPDDCARTAAPPRTAPPLTPFPPRAKARPKNRKPPSQRRARLCCLGLCTPRRRDRIRWKTRTRRQAPRALPDPCYPTRIPTQTRCVNPVAPLGGGGRRPGKDWPEHSLDQPGPGPLCYLMSTLRDGSASLRGYNPARYSEGGTAWQ